ncbi:MAG TPA: VanW family protein, partial [Candidatus Angelobacter sp.]|nr:VanW family protein [Candidatus Angelobacter sp.]
MHSKPPSRLGSTIFNGKAMLLRGVRFLSNLTQPVHRLGHTSQKPYSTLLAECHSPLWTAESLVENRLQFGKVQNLRKACRRLHLVEIPAGEIFSFWKQVGKAKRSAGYVRGRELRQGCLVPTVGGGLCQLSNSLYDVALQSGCEIVERHAHSAVVPGSAAEHGRDATIFWNYVDLRFRPAQNILITTALTHDALIVRFWGKQRLVSLNNQPTASRGSTAINTCTDCGVSECFRHVSAESSASAGRNAFLIDECWPEFEEFTRTRKSTADDLFLPYHSNWKKISRYAWDHQGYRRTIVGNVPTLRAAVKARLLPNSNLPPVAIQVARSEELADYYGERLAIDVSHVVVAQSLLPFLWRRGDLGGRTFDVLMIRLPLNALHRQLDDLVARFPERKTFQEFRAPDWMVIAENEALERASQVITPHSALANLFPLKTTRLQWKFPLTRQAVRGSCVVFPGPALARKGALELREALQGVGCQLRILGGQAMESKGLWDGIELAEPCADWLEQAAVVVQPAFVENNPRPLLRAL